MYIRIPAAAVRKIRRVGPPVGLCTVLWSFGCAGLLLGLGHRLPMWRNVFTQLATAMALVSVLFMFGIGCGLMLVGRSVAGEYLNLRQSRPTVRFLAVLWGGTIVTSGLSCLLLVLLVNTSASSTFYPQIHYTPLVVGYILLPVSSCVLAGVGYFLARRLLCPPPGLTVVHR
jgi:hypothetical protein